MQAYHQGRWRSSQSSQQSFSPGGGDKEDASHAIAWQARRLSQVQRRRRRHQSRGSCTFKLLLPSANLTTNLTRLFAHDISLLDCNTVTPTANYCALRISRSFDSSLAISLHTPHPQSLVFCAHRPALPGACAALTDNARDRNVNAPLYHFCSSFPMLNSP